MTQMTLNDAIKTARRHHQAGRWTEAENIYRQVLAQQPANAEAMCLLGTLAGQRGQWEAAVDLLRRAIAIKPANAAMHNNLANALKGMGQADQAIASYRRAIDLKPDDAEAHHNLGLTLRGASKTDEAIASFRQAVRCKPDHAEAHYELGIALQGAGQMEEAIASYRETIRCKPGFAEAHSNLGVALEIAGRFGEAVVFYQQAIRLRPDLPEPHNNLGNAFNAMGRSDEAIAAYRQALKIKPDYAEAHNNLGNAFCDMGRIDEAIAAYRLALRIKPEHAEAQGNILLAMHYLSPFDPRSLRIETEHWNRQHAQPLQRFIRTHANDRDPDRPLRIGYVSADFRNHSVSRFLLPLLEAHDHDAFEIFAYAEVPVADDTTAKLKACCNTWRSIVGVSDERVAEMIRKDRIDILVDLAGHTSGNRLLVFAHKAAPVQVTWLGYPGTTGMSAMDYRLTDARADPPGVADEFSSERLIRLPRTDWCFQPRDGSPPVNELPAIANGYVTFGSFNHLAKMNEPLLKMWAKILRATPASKLRLKAASLGCASVQQRVRQVMSDAGIAPDRLELLGWVAPAEHLAQYHRVDIALDTYPYHGTTTTCESFWMGVPVVTLAGESHVSRVGVSLLSNMGLSQLIAQAPEQYVQIAVDLANGLPRLAELRRTLRVRMGASPLMDGVQFARDVEAAYRLMWRDWSGRT